MDINRTKTTIDPNETKVFQDLSTVWWSNAGLQILKKINICVRKYICTQTIQTGLANKNHEDTLKPLRNLHILEVGCGGGLLSEELANAGCNLIGIDPNEDLLKVAKDHADADPTLPKITYVAETVEEHCKSNAGKYDVVVANFVLEHVSDPEYFIECCSKCVKPGGSLFMSAIAKTYLAWFIEIFLLEYVLRLLPIGLHHLDKFINASATENFIISNGFKIFHTQGFYYDVFGGGVYSVPIHSYLYITHAINTKISTKENKKIHKD